MTDYFVLTRADRDKLDRLLAMVDGASGLNVTPDGLSVPGRGGAVRRGSDRGPQGYWAEITGSLAIVGEDNRWRYAWKRVTRTSEGWADAVAPHNFSGSTSSGWAINAAEANNDDAGVQGNGVDLDGDIFTDNSGLGMVPIGTGAVVWLVPGVDGDGDPCFTFSQANAIDGECA